MDTLIEKEFLEVLEEEKAAIMGKSNTKQGKMTLAVTGLCCGQLLVGLPGLER